jgi:serine/threonine protein kinase
MAFGSPGYAAPEQYGKAQTTPYADIYSLGALLHQMLTGNDPTEAPFRFQSLHAYNLHHPQTNALHLLDRLLLQMVDLDPDNRPGSMALVKQQLEYIAEQCVI